MRVADAFPKFALELRRLLLVSDEPIVAEQVDRIELLSRCGCGESFCSTFYVGEGQSETTLTLEAKHGMVNVDLGTNGRILTVEVLDRPDVEVELVAAIERMRRAT